MSQTLKTETKKQFEFVGFGMGAGADVTLRHVHAIVLGSARVQPSTHIYNWHMSLHVVCCEGCHVSCSSLGDADEDHVFVAVVFRNLCVDLRG